MLTQEQLKELLHYNPETGVFTWLIAPSKNVKAGSIAGSLCRKGYIIIGINKKLYKSHRLAWLYMTGCWPKDQIDHEDHIRHNNKWLNLKEATNSENHKNRAIRKTNTSGITGVYWHKEREKWLAEIKVNNKKIHLMISLSKFEAACARKSAENKYGFHRNHGV